MFYPIPHDQRPILQACLLGQIETDRARDASKERAALANGDGRYEDL
jgi:hypothetical protein